MQSALDRETFLGLSRFVVRSGGEEFSDIIVSVSRSVPFEDWHLRTPILAEMGE